MGRKSYGLTKNELTEKYAESKVQVQEVIEHKQFLSIDHTTCRYTLYLQLHLNIRNGEEHEKAYNTFTEKQNQNF